MSFNPGWGISVMKMLWISQKFCRRKNSVWYWIHSLTFRKSKQKDGREFGTVFKYTNITIHVIRGKKTLQLRNFIRSFFAFVA